MTSKLTREQATDTEIQMLIDSHEKGTAMFMRTDAYYFMAKELQERRKAVEDKDLQGVIGALEHPAGINAAGKQVVRRALEELQERRKAERDSEPVAVVEPSDYVTAAQLVGEGPARKAVHELYEGALRIGDKLYRHAQQPVVPENRVTAEHRRVIEMLLNVCGAAFELADDSCQQDVDGEDCHVVPDDAFQKLSDALDEIENTLPTEDIDRPDVFLAWSAMPRAALKSIIQAGNSPVIPGAEQRIADAVELLKQAAPAMLADNGGPDGPLVGRMKSPVIPDGYVMVPVEPTEAMMLHNSGCQHHAWDDPDCAMRQTRRLIWSHMLAAAPQDVPALNSVQSVATVPGRWIPVSERVPKSNGVYFGWDGKRVLEVNCFFGGFSANQFIHGEITHWMPLPAAPQEVPDGK